MDSTPPTSPTTTALVVTPESLVAAFAAVPDPRRQASVAYPLPAILSLAVMALLCAHTSVLAIAEWGAEQSADLLRRLGFSQGHTPCQTTLHRLFRKLDAHALSVALGTHFAQSITVDPEGRGSEGVALDGKAQRGHGHYDPAGPPVHALAAFCQEQGVVLAEEPITTGADKQEAELTVAPTVLARIDWRGRVLTGDALFCQRHLCQQVRAAGGDYLLIVKANQPHLFQAIEWLFDPPFVTVPLVDQREARSVDTGHGRGVEIRHLIASTDLVDYLDWPGLAQVFRVKRTWWEGDEQKEQVRYGITSLPPACGSARRLLTLKRGHWLIENRLHRTKDVSLAEDASLIHLGQGPAVASLLRDATLSLLRRAGCRRIAAQLRHYSQFPEEALALLLQPASAHA